MRPDPDQLVLTHRYLGDAFHSRPQVLGTSFDLRLDAARFKILRLFAFAQTRSAGSRLTAALCDREQNDCEDADSPLGSDTALAHEGEFELWKTCRVRACDVRGELVESEGSSSARSAEQFARAPILCQGPL